MDLVQRMLLTLAHIIVVGRSERTAIALASPEDLLLNAFDGVVAPELLRQHARQLLPALDEAPQIEAASWHELARQIEAYAARDASAESKLAAAERTLAQLLTICLLTDTAQVSSFRIPLSRPEIFRSIHKIQAAPANDQVGATILGNIPRDLTIRFGEHDVNLNKIELRYTGAPIYPLLTVHRRSFSELDGMSGSRVDWRQQANERYDLQFAETGHVRTRLVELPCSLKVGCGSLDLSEQAGVDVLSTQIISPDGELLAECIRVAEQRQNTSV